ncbi:MAG: hypothetical protein NTU66_05590 [Elusimicrobia bacterium]|nr:hypothetical protein [Elusimicrobiota bacterium]
MRTILLLAIAVGLGYWIVTDTMNNGKLEQALDTYLSPANAASVEYFWAGALSIIGHTPAALYRNRRVIQKHPDSLYAPLAWVDIIDLLDAQHDRAGVFREADQFVAAYPQHPKVAYVRKKVNVLQSGI